MFIIRLYCLLAPVCLSFLLTGCNDSSDNPQPESRETTSEVSLNGRSDIDVFVHYMPWFEAKTYGSKWGWHWTMNTCNPDKVDAQGRREVASHYYPVIGPYDSCDPLVLDYHCLLIKYAGIKGVIVDWYGSRAGIEKEATEALLKACSKAGIGLAICYEDNNNLSTNNSESTNVKLASDDMVYLSKYFFNQNAYIKYNNRPLLLCFGPQVLQKAVNWTEVFASSSPKPAFFPLYGHADRAGKNVSGEYTWVNSDNVSFWSQLNTKYNGAYIASAFPGFNDFYKEGGSGNGYTFYDSQNGAFLSTQLEAVERQKPPMLQIATWNDFGEGTQIEPTLEDGFKYLVTIQKFNKVNVDSSVFNKILELYTLRVKFSSDKDISNRLDEAYSAFASANPDKAISIIDSID